MTPRHWLARLRKSAGYSNQNSLAAQLGVHVATVSRWEAGTASVADRHRSALAAALGISPGELDQLLLDPAVAERRASADHRAEAADASGPLRPADPSPVRAPASVPAALGALGTAPADPIPADSVELLRIGLDRSVRAADTSFLAADWELTAYEHACAVRIAPPSAFISDIGVDIVDLREYLDTHSGSADTQGDAQGDAGVHRSLLRVSAWLCGLMAVALTEVGQLAAASRWWRTARQTARAGDDQRLQTWICGRWALAAQATGMPSLALRVTEQARGSGDHSPCAGSAEVRAARVLALATSNNPALGRLALTELAELEHLFAQLPEKVRNERDALWGWPERRLHATRTAVLVMLDDDGRSRTDLTKDLRTELSDLEPEAIRERAEVELKTSMLLVSAGQVLEGLETAAAALKELPIEHRTATLAYLARRVHQRVPERHRNHDTAQTLQAFAGHYRR
ncbi:helix-turn-helix domain-containing protein [Actinomadura sp. LD22]|uniref:Helix-turn-helix domain-containing protein n=1 Tax=Actinomadura physcomitrii TaxID=2650748 RepID=A0A6I4MG11_9ACTN|nr:helix-turn-helix transcriptional regulator [Actinomadura physcomitrii]MWA02661.1 helix-turn-helix domain-containing protein [Actinomadura physcomitrii]